MSSQETLRRELLNLTTSKLIKKCKEANVSISTQNPNKKEMVDALLKKMQKKDYDEKEADDPNKSIHQKARVSPYANTDKDGVIKRFEIKDEDVRWESECKNYEPTIYTHHVVLAHKIPDKNEQDITKNNIKYKFNALELTDDNKQIDRRSHIGSYKLDATYHNLPLNPIGRTGMRGRGHLWRWGPNHAADPIVTKWKRDDNNKIVCDKKTKKPILEFVAIERNDGGGWAIPGGMVDPGERVNRTLKREFGEESMDTYGIKSKEEKQKVLEKIDKFFRGGKLVYKGYVDDPRNTDNAWMETVAVNFHDEKGDAVVRWKLKAGDDASKVKWMEISRKLKLYASHSEFIKQVVIMRKAHW